MKTERDTVGPDKGQGLRRRKFCEDVTGDREWKCSKVQEPVLRQAQSQEAVGEMDTGERVVGESGVKRREGGEGVLEKVKSILQEDKQGGEEGSEGEGGGGEEWTEVMGKGKGRKCSEQKGST